VDGVSNCTSPCALPVVIQNMNWKCGTLLLLIQTDILQRFKNFTITCNVSINVQQTILHTR
jgi:hypothetical protein